MRKPLPLLSSWQGRGPSRSAPGAYACLRLLHLPITPALRLDRHQKRMFCGNRSARHPTGIATPLWGFASDWDTSLTPCVGCWVSSAILAGGGFMLENGPCRVWAAGTCLPTAQPGPACPALVDMNMLIPAADAWENAPPPTLLAAARAALHCRSPPSGGVRGADPTPHALAFDARGRCICCVGSAGVLAMAGRPSP